MVFDPTRVGQNCEFCGSPALVDYKEIKAPIRPQSLLPFTRQPSRSVREQHPPLVRAASGSRPEALQEPARSSTRSRASTSRTGRSTRRSHCPWDAEAGHYYYTTETVPRQPGAARETRQVQHVRWEPASGRRSITSSTTSRCPGRRACRTRCCEQVEPFPTNELVPYDTAFLSGFVVEHYQVVLLDAAKRSEDAMPPS